MLQVDDWLPEASHGCSNPDELFLSQDELPHDDVDHPRFHDMAIF